MRLLVCLLLASAPFADAGGDVSEESDAVVNDMRLFANVAQDLDKGAVSRMQRSK